MIAVECYEQHNVAWFLLCTLGSCDSSAFERIELRAAEQCEFG